MEWHVDVQPPPEQPAATEARVLAVGVQPSTFIGASGPESRLMLGLKLLGNGSLTDVRIALRLLAPDGSVVWTVPVVSAPRLRTPWWSQSVRCDLGRLVPTARLEMALSSKEVNETGAIQVKW